jgi:HSP20 family protein
MLVSYRSPNYTLPSAFDWVLNPQTDRRPESRLEVTDDGYTLRLDVPGVTSEGLEIEVIDRSLKLSTKRTDGPTEEKAAYSWKLPKTADAERITAELSYGVLTLKVGKQASATPRKILIEDRSAAA